MVSSEKLSMGDSLLYLMRIWPDRLVLQSVSFATEECGAIQKLIGRARVPVSSSSVEAEGLRGLNNGWITLRRACYRLKTFPGFDSSVRLDCRSTRTPC